MPILLPSAKMEMVRASQKYRLFVEARKIIYDWCLGKDLSDRQQASAMLWGLHAGRLAFDVTKAAPKDNVETQTDPDNGVGRFKAIQPFKELSDFLTSRGTIDGDRNLAVALLKGAIEGLEASLPLSSSDILKLRAAKKQQVDPPQQPRHNNLEAKDLTPDDFMRILALGEQTKAPIKRRRRSLNKAL